jgi:chitinase domain-containing protein 1
MDKELFSKKAFDLLAPHIRYFSLMTYDYSSVQNPGANAPIEWIRTCVENLVPDSKDIKRSQILMGLNFYGYHYTPTGGGPIVGSQYLKLLENFKGKIQWDDKSEEHFFEVK